MDTTHRPETVRIRGGRFDGLEVPCVGFQIEVPIPEAERVNGGPEFFAIPYAEDAEGNVYGDGTAMR